jgi:hypothetical protein
LLTMSISCDRRPRMFNRFATIGVPAGLGSLP